MAVGVSSSPSSPNVACVYYILLIEVLFLQFLYMYLDLRMYINNTRVCTNSQAKQAGFVISMKLATISSEVVYYYQPSLPFVESKP